MSPERPDYLASGLLQGLMRPSIYACSPRIFPTVLSAVVTFGILPLIQMPRRLHAFAQRERDQLWHLGKWMHLQFGREAESVTPREPAMDRAVHVLRLISWMCALAALGSIVWYLSFGRDLEDLGRATYGFFSPQWKSYRHLDERLFVLWMPALSIGYAAHWTAVQVHQARVRRFLSRFNSIVLKHGLKPVVQPPEALGLRPLWLLGAFGFMCFGMLWGVPLMLAGGAQTRYIRRRSVWIRAELAQRVGDVLRQRRPTMMLTVPVVLRRKCPVELCQAPLPQVAAFCPRCGTRVAAVDRVA
jgi:hypothetical protein